MTITIESIASIIICAKTGTKGYMNGAGSAIYSGIGSIFFSGILSFNPVFLIFGLFEMIISGLIMTPVGAFMALSYFYNMILFMHHVFSGEKLDVRRKRKRMRYDG